MPELKAISDYPKRTVAANSDLIFITANVSSGNTPFSGHISVGNVFASGIPLTSSNVYATDLYCANIFTPANSSVGELQGRIWFDNDYIYAATSNSAIKRAALTSF